MSALRAALVVPAAPALLPGLGGSADPLASWREDARAAVADLLTALGPAERVSVVAAAAHPETGGASRRPVQRRWPLDAPSGAARYTTGGIDPDALPAGLDIARSLLPAGHSRLDNPRSDTLPSDCSRSNTLRSDHSRHTTLSLDQGLEFVSVADDAAPAECLALGERLVAEGTRALIVVADGPATLTEKAPGHWQPDAPDAARSLHAALAEADADALAALDPPTCDRLWVRARAPLQVLAGSLQASSERAWRGAVARDEAPFGVQYLLATIGR